MRDWPFHQNRQHLYKWTICLRALYYTYQIRHKFSGGFAPYYPFQSVGTHDIDQIRSPRGSKLTKAAMQSEEYEWACDFSTPSPAAPPLHTILSNHAWGRWSILTSSSFLTEDVSHPMKRSIPQREHRGREDHKDRPTEWSNLWVLSLRWAGPPQGHPLSISHVRPHFPLTTQTLFSKAWDMALGFRKLLRHCVQLEKITQPHVRATELSSSSFSWDLSAVRNASTLWCPHPIQVPSGGLPRLDLSPGVLYHTSFLSLLAEANSHSQMRPKHAGRRREKSLSAGLGCGILLSWQHSSAPPYWITQLRQQPSQDRWEILLSISLSFCNQRLQ